MSTALLSSLALDEIDRAIVGYLIRFYKDFPVICEMLEESGVDALGPCADYAREECEDCDHRMLYWCWATGDHEERLRTLIAQYAGCPIADPENEPFERRIYPDFSLSMRIQEQHFSLECVAVLRCRGQSWKTTPCRWVLVEPGMIGDNRMLLVEQLGGELAIQRLYGHLTLQDWERFHSASPVGESAIQAYKDAGVTSVHDLEGLR